MKKVSVLLLAFVSSFAWGQSDDELFEASLEDLLNMEITVASKTGLSAREAPGIVSVITKDEIKNSGARDMIDVLRLVPGISFNSDVEGIVGISMRGNWANEGKLLLMVDGQEQNEVNYGSLQFGNRYDVNQIERVEIIRGPGSSIYGGFAELGVINIITKDGADLNGVEVAGTYGAYSDTYGRQNLSLAVGKQINDFKFSVAGFLANGQRSNAQFTDVWGDQASMKDASALDQASVNVGVQYKGLQGRLFVDNYSTTTVAYYDAVLTGSPLPVDYPSITGELKYDWAISEKLTLTPKFNYLKQTPWKSVGYEDPAYDFEVSVNKVTGGLHANYDINETINLIGGAEYFVEPGREQTSG